MKSSSRRLGLVMVLTLLVCVLYWKSLLDAQQAQRTYVEEQTRMRAVRLSQTLAVQVETLFSGLAYVNSSLASTYLADRPQAFERSVRTALETFPKGSITQVAVANAQGELIYLNPGPPGGRNTGPLISIADRPYFQALASGQHQGLIIGEPVMGRVSGRWSIPISYALYRNGAFAGALGLSVSPDYIANYFREIFADDNDVALLLNDSGHYLARSSRLEQTIGTPVPGSRPFLNTPQQVSGEYQALAAIDHIDRFYAWHRVSGYPLLVSIGLGTHRALDLIEAQQYDTRVRNLISILLILSFVAWIALLIDRLHRDQARLTDNEQRLKLALQGGDMAIWDWHIPTKAFHYDSAWTHMLGFEPDELPMRAEIIFDLLHPDDIDAMRERLRAHLRGDVPMFESEHRMRHQDGHWVWVSVRGGVTSRARDGTALRMAGIQSDITVRMTEANLREALFNNTAAEILLTHPDTRTVLAANRRAIDTFAPDGRVLAGESMMLLHMDAEHYERFGKIYDTLRTQHVVQIEFPFRNRHGDQGWYAVTGSRLNPEAPDSEVIWTLLDITERRQVEQRLADTEQRLTQVIRQVPGGVLVEDEQGSVLVINQELCRLLGIERDASMLTGLRVADLPDYLPAEEAARLREQLPLAPDASQEADPHTQTTLLYQDRMLQVSCTVIQREGAGLGRLWIINDVTARLRREYQLNRMATTDSLTELANRASFLARLNGELHRPDPQGLVLMADLDHFKQVNDTYGHAAGDDVLRHLAQVFRSVLRKDDLVGRLGGEEFAVLLPNVGDDEGMILAERIRTTLADSVIPTAAGVVRVSLSIGMARLDQGDATAVLAAADAALYRAKRNGRNRVEAAWQDVG